MTKEDIVCEDLQRLIAVKVGKIDFNQVTLEDISKIKEITIGKKSLNGKENNADLTILELFKDLQELIVSDFALEQNDINNILNIQSLKKLEIRRCEFNDDINFDNLGEKEIAFTNCKLLPFRYPKTKKVEIRGSSIDFNLIDFNSAQELIIQTSRIFNAHDLTYYPNIKTVNFDGSDLFSNYSNSVSDIKVSQLTSYSHEDEIDLCGASEIR